MSFENGVFFCAYVNQKGPESVEHEKGGCSHILHHSPGKQGRLSAEGTDMFVRGMKRCEHFIYGSNTVPPSHSSESGWDEIPSSVFSYSGIIYAVPKVMLSCQKTGKLAAEIEQQLAMGTGT